MHGRREETNSSFSFCCANENAFGDERRNRSGALEATNVNETFICHVKCCQNGEN